MKRVTAIIPCHNEATSIGAVVHGFPRRQLAAAGYELEVLVVDNNSTDHTAAIATAAGARVICEPRQGKGYAIQAGFAAIGISTDYVVMLDGDATYRPQEVLRLLEPLESGFCDVVIGSRIHGRINVGSMRRLNRLGNRLYSRLVRATYGVAVTDVLTGYFAWSRPAIERLRPHLQAGGFAIEMEMITKLARLGIEVFSVPISYDSRAGHSSLQPLRDGARILAMYARNLLWRPAGVGVQRLAFVSDAVMPFHTGGKERRLHEITRRLVQEGREVHIYTMQWWPGPRTMRIDGVYFHALCRHYPLYRGGRRSIIQALAFGWAAHRLLWVRFDALDADSMPFWPLYSLRLVCWLRRKPLIATWHEVTDRAGWQAYLGRYAGLAAAGVEWLAARLPNIIIANSPHTARRLRASGLKQRIVTIPLGVDLDYIAAVVPAGADCEVVYAGRLVPHKNVGLLIEAIAILKPQRPRISCLIIGQGSERAALEDQAARLGLAGNITFRDFYTDQAALYGALKTSRMFVLPSYQEGFGLMVIEAQAAGLPIITTNSPGNAARELVAEGIDGYVVEPEPAALAERIEYVLAHPGILRPAASLTGHDWAAVSRRVERVLTSTP